MEMVMAMVMVMKMMTMTMALMRMVIIHGDDRMRRASQLGEQPMTNVCVDLSVLCCFKNTPTPKGIMTSKQTHR